MTIEAWTIVLALVLFAVALPYVFRSILTLRLDAKIKKSDYEGAIKYLNTPLYRYVFSKFEYYRNMIRIMIAKNDMKGVETYTREVLDSSLSTSESFQIASMTYYYFLNEGNGDLCAHLLPLLAQKCSANEQQYNEMLYRILIERKAEDIERIEELLERNEDNGILCYLLGVQYMYQGNKDLAKKYLNKAKNTLKGTPYHARVKNLLNNI